MLTKRYFLSIIAILILIMILNWSWQKVRKTNLMLYRHRLERKGLGCFLTRNIGIVPEKTLKKSVVKALFIITKRVWILTSASRKTGKKC